MLKVLTIIIYAFYKLRQADVVQLQYAASSTNKVGKIMADVMTHYRRMIKIYRNYSDPKNFKNIRYTVKEVLNAYSIVQGDYNEIMLGVKSFQEVFAVQNAKIKKLAKTYNIAEDLLLEMIKAGVDVDGVIEAHMRNRTYGRMMKGTGDLDDTLVDADSVQAEASSKKLRSTIEEIEMEGFDFPKGRSFNAWVKKNGNNTKEAEYKKSLRYKKWSEKWDVFNPDVEGVKSKIPDKIPRIGPKNASDFFMNELKKDFK